MGRRINPTEWDGESDRIITIKVPAWMWRRVYKEQQKRWGTAGWAREGIFSATLGGVVREAIYQMLGGEDGQGQ
jgi:hypothetical protein